MEMVTGYTNLATHAVLLKALLLTDEGKPAWAGKLRSHDAVRGGGSESPCGIHVHVQKPASLIHASKLRYFINSAANRQLIEDVARRYNAGFARINNAHCTNSPEKSAAQLIKPYKRWGDKITKQHAASALMRINGERYEALNFQNPNTVEYRIFRGSMLYESVMACLEFSVATWHYTRFAPAVRLTQDGFMEWINHPDNRADTRNLRVYLKRKGWDAFVPRPHKDAGPTTTTTEADDLPVVTPQEVDAIVNTANL
jgi:hypothetical protein